MNKKKVVVVVLTAVVATIGVAWLAGSNDNRQSALLRKPSTEQQRNEAARVPAYMTDANVIQTLRPTLAPEQFFGKAREAYQAAREIPETLAQLPCYCYCDNNLGHKSLHTCYESDHSAHCATCINEALMAYRLQKDEGLSPAQIRERIIKEFGHK